MLQKTSDWKNKRFDSIIDVRAPSEFLDDHIIGAINCPVLNDHERDKVGTLYKKVSGFKARLSGASIIARNIARHIESDFSNFTGSWKPLIYCWRGGQRSRAMGLVLQEIGWRVTILDGGHKKYRENAINLLSTISKKFKLILISGQTGSAKTHILHEMAECGAQVLDLEGLANHRGSLLGSFSGEPQPSQKYFESLILDKLLHFSGDRCVYVESESSKIGNLHIPAGLWRAMSTAPYIELRIPAGVRADFLINYYDDLLNDQDRFEVLFLQARTRVNANVIRRWRQLLERKSWHMLALDLIKNYYDPAYLMHRAQKNRDKLMHLDGERLTNYQIKKFAKKIIDFIENSVEVTST